MYTDTKNLANLCVNNTNASAKFLNHEPQQHQQQSDKFKLKKVWKPLLRLMSLKSTAASTSGAKSNRSIPNNVNLNNAQSMVQKNIPKDLLFTSAEDAEPLQDNEQCLHHQKLPDFSRLSESAASDESTSSTTPSLVEFISRVSVEKTPLNTCNNCVHGRNCQHTQYHQNLDMPATPSQPQSQLPSPEAYNFITAEDGCFVWSEACVGDIDEQLLRQWFWQNSWQFAENATVC